MPVTRPRVFVKHIADLHTHHLYGVTIARLNRAGIDLASAPGVKLQFGDHITCVGEDRLRQVEAIVGNQTSALQHSQIIPIFVGIALGVLLGSIPVFIPGVPALLSLGLAGGPVVVAIDLARIGAIGPLHWNMPTVGRGARHRQGQLPEPVRRAAGSATAAGPGLRRRL